MAPFVVFGYGSLIFKPPPHTVAEVAGYLKGYTRRFAQASHDHRGTPECPGRVVTLVHTKDWDLFAHSDKFVANDSVWGVAYTIDPVHEAEVRAYLDYREKDGYTMEELDIYGIEDGKEKIIISGAFCYVGHADNPSFVGYESLEDAAAIIAHSVGPSGPNKDYLYELGVAVRRLSPESKDAYLIALEEKVREYEGPILDIEE